MDDEGIVSQRAGVFLIFHGIDTVADLFLNGIYLASTDNMFVRYRINVRYLLKVRKKERIIEWCQCHSISGFG